jgi:biotin synthase-like enzyme|tara:strand:+ start:102 stop:335 length:234 start_codon:yes stop_codon:yes gene_type:complete
MNQLNAGMIFGTLIIMGIGWSVAATVDNGVTLAEIRTTQLATLSSLKAMDDTNRRQNQRLEVLEVASAVAAAIHEDE